MQSRHVSRVIAAPFATVHDYVREPDHLPLWAEGLAQAEVSREGDDLVIASPMGQVRVRFVPPNDFGVVDHDVTMPNGVTQNNPMRVLVHPEGSEVVVSVRQLDLTDEEFERDCAQMAADLDRLAELLERS
ncbi:polyketide cyclase [Aestuariimicrobium kwangyangense]|uniref:polyketide cyclase n=1 Tax=Aestuariimicrobium kwangyangense TaxID=396389 RepID=UPI0003B73A54|nr:polyketide cyclase [Aestuariimicrobium kwangyangense]